MLGKVSSLQAVAKHFAVSEAQVRKWEMQGCSELKEGPYNLDKITEWLRNEWLGAAEKPNESTEAAEAESEPEKSRSKTNPFLIKLAIPIFMLFLGTIVGIYLRDKPVRIDGKKEELAGVLEKLGKIFARDQGISIYQVINAEASANAYPWGQARVWSQAKYPSEAETAAQVEGPSNARGSARTEDNSNLSASTTKSRGKPEETNRSPESGRDLRPSTPRRSALVSLEVAFYYEQARTIEQDLYALGVESLSYIDYIMLAHGAAQIGRFEEAAEYLNKAETVARGIQKTLVLGLQGHFHYTNSRDSEDRRKGNEYYSIAIQNLDPARSGNRFRADLLAAWSLDELESSDPRFLTAFDNGVEHANEAIRIYNSIPGAWIPLDNFVKSLRDIGNRRGFSFVDDLPDLPSSLKQNQNHSDAQQKQNSPSQKPEGNSQAPVEQRQTPEPSVKQAMDIIHHHINAMWKDLHQLGLSELQQDQLKPPERSDEKQE